MQCVLRPLVNELLRLEEGINIVVEDGRVHHVVVVLENVVENNLGLHGIRGYTESFSHSFACDICRGCKLFVHYYFFFEVLNVCCRLYCFQTDTVAKDNVG